MRLPWISDPLLKNDPLDCAIYIKVLLRFFKQNSLLLYFLKRVGIRVGDRCFKEFVDRFVVFTEVNSCIIAGYDFVAGFFCPN